VPLITFTITVAVAVISTVTSNYKCKYNYDCCCGCCPGSRYRPVVPRSRKGGKDGTPSAGAVRGRGLVRWRAAAVDGRAEAASLPASGKHHDLSIR